MRSLTRFAKPCFALFVAVGMTSAGGGEAEAQRSRADARVLAGHPFMPSVLVDQPFMTRQYSMALDLGAALYEFKGLTTAELQALAAAGASEKMNFASFALSFRTRQPIWEAIGLQVEASADALSGIDVDSLLGQGGNFGYRIGGGPFLNIYTGERVSLSSSFDFLWGRSYDFTPFPVISELENRVNTAAASGRGLQPGDLAGITSGLLSEYENFVFRPRMNMALGIFEGMGLFVDVAFLYTDFKAQSGASQGTEQELRVGAGLSFNFDVYGAYIPLGLTLAYRRDQDLSGGTGDGINHFELGLYYSSGKHFTFGLAAFGNLQTEELGNGKELQQIEAGAQITMTFYE